MIKCLLIPETAIINCQWQSSSLSHLAHLGMTSIHTSKSGERDNYLIKQNSSKTICLLCAHNSADSYNILPDINAVYGFVRFKIDYFSFNNIIT